MSKPAEHIMKTQLDRPERQVLEKVVCRMREKAENDIGFRIRNFYGLAKADTVPDYLDDAQRETREKLIDAVQREHGGNKAWKKALGFYVKGCGYTLVNRVAAFRCMEVRGFLDRAVTRFRDDGKTPAADPIIRKHFLDKKEGVAEAYRQACREMADEIEILFDPTSPYSLLDAELDDALFETFEKLCRMLDEIENATWGADDVLGWVYEYYNLPDLELVRRKARGSGLEPEDVPSANQFYTPHWVVRLLADNSIGKLFLEHRGTLHQAVQQQQDLFAAGDRKSRGRLTAEPQSVTELCSYLVPTAEAKRKII